MTKKYAMSSRKRLSDFIFVALLAFIFPLKTYAQLPNLGTAINFAVFTTIGALNNVQTSDITGDIGTNNGAISDFGAPTIVNGNIESVNGITAQCAIDVQAAYNEIFSITPTVVDHSPSFGSGETLSAGVYFINEAGSLALNLTLDAAGDPDAIFIFQFRGAFTSGSSSQVNLINSASVCNVFWIAEGAINLSALTEMTGTFISNNGAVSLGSGGVLEGRMLTTTGEASVDNALINLPICTPTVLPTNLLIFKGYCNKQKNVLEWITDAEINNDFFTVERSLNGKSWQIVGTINGAGNSLSTIHYSLIDSTHHETITYYRLKQTDFDGNSTYTDVISVQKCFLDETLFTIFPNPSTGKFEIHLNGDIGEVSSIDVFNSQGHHMYSSINVQSTIDLSEQDPGLYFVRIQQNSGNETLKFILSY
jgi:hypothetical protein